MMKPKMMILAVQRSCVRLMEGSDDNDEAGDGDGGIGDDEKSMKISDWCSGLSGGWLSALVELRQGENLIGLPCHTI